MTPREYLAKRDPKLGAVISRIQLPPLRARRNRFQFLVEAIIGQQLSDKAATTIANRFRSQFSARGSTFPISLRAQRVARNRNPARAGFPSPEAVLRVSPGRIRAVGVSNAKAAYIHNVARAVAKKELQLAKFDRLSDTEVSTALTAVKGIGPWTAEMFLIFALRRPDIFSPGDGGLQSAMRKLYRLRKTPTAAWVRRTTDRWRPHRSLACRYVWASLDAKG